MEVVLRKGEKDSYSLWTVSSSIIRATVTCVITTIIPPILCQQAFIEKKNVNSDNKHNRILFFMI